MSINIAIDGPAGAGKSTIARKLASELGFIYVDTGAMYRAMAYYLTLKGIDKDHTEDIDQVCLGANISISYENGEQLVLLNGENVNAYLRTEAVGNMASISSARPAVREKLTVLQKELAQKQNVVMDGRDIGTTVLPNAQVKIFMTADARVRAKRRYDELVAKGLPADLDEIEKDIKERDERDMNRPISPLKQAEDAILLDTSHMGIQEVVSRVKEICRERGLI